MVSDGVGGVLVAFWLSGEWNEVLKISMLVD